MRLKSAVIALVALFSLVVPVDISQAAWLEYSSSSNDVSNSNVVTRAYDLTRIDFGINDANSDEFWFFLNFAEPVQGNMFSKDSSWAAIMIDTNLDGKFDFSIQTNSTKAYSSNYYMDAPVMDRRSGSVITYPGCSALTWTNLTTSANWIAFSIKKSCLPLPSTFAIQGYSDRIANDNTDFDYAPDSMWRITPGTNVTTTTTTSSLEQSIDPALRIQCEDFNDEVETLLGAIDASSYKFPSWKPTLSVLQDDVIKLYIDCSKIDNKYFLGQLAGSQAHLEDFRSQHDEIVIQANKELLAAKKTTITCVKGTSTKFNPKLTKKITGINPKCPAGYRKL